MPDTPLAPRTEDPGPSPGLGYFLVRVRRTPDTPGELSGLVERLGSGEKRPFRTGEELARVVAEWSQP
jgi:hypothetical protein